VFPVAIDKNKKELDLAMADPLDLAAIDFVEQKTGTRVKPKAAEPSTISEYISTRYASSLSEEVTEALKEVGEEDKKASQLEVSRTGFVREEKIAEIVSHILEFAVKSRASDVHIEPQEGQTRVRYRIDGILQEKLTIPRGLHDALVSRIKILAGLKIDEKRIPQDGRFNFKASTEEVDLRVSTLPTTWGEKVVMRILKKQGGIPELPELGLRGRALKNLQDSILRPHGIILICGPTGSGKTTTLYSIIQKLNTQKVNIMTLEDPIEYKIQGVNQVQVNPAAGLTFASGLRSFLRQDPDIILVGEIRDKETADLAIQASLTGHLVFSTLHTNDASGALPRLLEMGAEPYLLASSMTAVVAQRVVRKVHDKCKTSYQPDPKVVEQMKAVLGPLWQGQDNITLWKGQGDPECNNTGYYGRVGIFEVLPVTERISRLILERVAAADIEKLAKEEGMVSLKQDGMLKVLEGITTIEEVLRVAEE
jgi:type IV pilus assembly protein PilB